MYKIHNYYYKTTMKQRKGSSTYIGHIPTSNVSIVSIYYLSRKIILWLPTLKKKHDMPDLFSVFVVRCKYSYTLK